ncbi:MAG TPA: terpene cyclase/mutase family protein [Prosthecobacter sp.]|nr:terpene cyclase/mutase family protein [Prosthecobacter sp.]HRK13263.1 terpene cyclase/mutase family protein [Prosthecobacter sp.]
MDRLTFSLAAVFLMLAPGGKARETTPAETPKAAFPQGSPDEPLRGELSLAKAAESLDGTALAWVRKHKCGSCHTGWPYVSSRALLTREAPADALAEVRAFFEGRITNWDADEQVKKHQHREIVGTAAALAMHDAQSTGRLHPVTRQALDRMWALQRKDGAWNWPKCGWPPFEVDDYYGAVLAAVGAGHAPENYARSDAAKAGVDKMRAYLKKTPAPNLHHRAWLLWAAVRLDGLLSDEEKQVIIRDLLALQRVDGGWSMESLGPEWTGREGGKSNPNAPSDGYGTGLVVLVLREAGLPAGHAALQRGVKWLSTNQRESGRWFTRSLNGVPQHFISDTATVFAVLALKACASGE